MSHALRFARLIDAPPEEVFAAFTGAEGHEAFYGLDDAGWIVRSECDLRVGGVWTSGVRSPPQVSCIDIGTCFR